MRVLLWAAIPVTGISPSSGCPRRNCGWSIATISMRGPVKLWLAGLRSWGLPSLASSNIFALAYKLPCALINSPDRTKGVTLPRVRSSKGCRAAVWGWVSHPGRHPTCSSPRWAGLWAFRRSWDCWWVLVLVLLLGSERQPPSCDNLAWAVPCFDL